MKRHRTKIAIQEEESVARDAYLLAAVVLVLVASATALSLCCVSYHSVSWESCNMNSKRPGSMMIGGGMLWQTPKSYPSCKSTCMHLAAFLRFEYSHQGHSQHNGKRGAKSQQQTHCSTQKRTYNGRYL